MTAPAAGLALWALLAVASAWVWLPPTRRPLPALLSRSGGLVGTVTVLVAGTALVTLLASLGPPLAGRWTWLVAAVAALAAVLTGGAVTQCLLALADATTRRPVGRVHKAVLRGGAWIGALERLALLAILLAGWPDGVAVLVAVKGLARYPELRSGQGTGAAERFLIGTLASLGWAAACAGVALLLA